MDERTPHAVVVPGPGLGHVNGCLLLAKALLSEGFCVTMALFERPYKAHVSKGRDIRVSHPSVHLEIVPDDLPFDAAASYSDLCQVTPAMHQNLLHLLQSFSAQQRPATCLISDSVMAWTQHVADRAGIPRVDYWTANAMSYLIILALPDLFANGHVGCHQGPLPSSWKSKNPIFVDSIPGFPSFPLDEVAKDFRHALLEKNPLLQRYMEVAQYIKHVHCVLIHSIYDLEPRVFQALRNVVHLDALPIGPLLQQYDNATSIDTANTLTLKWLDAHPKSSVIFVAFGTISMHAHDEIVELAHGLEASGKAFLWVISSNSIAQGCKLDDVLPHGFKDRTSARGLIMPWVSQWNVLAHPAVGGFLSHCGWNSTLESIWMGVPMLTCPKRADQPINSRLISKEWGVGIELETNHEGAFSRHEVKAGICALLDSSIGNQAREKAKELSQVLKEAPFEGGQSHTNMIKFTSQMRELCLKQAKTSV